MSQQDQQPPQPEQFSSEDLAKAIVGFLIVLTWIAVIAFLAGLAFHLFTH
jgi:hypothetical protein